MSFAEKLAEHLVARQSILESYIDLCPIPCFIVNRDGETVFVNESYQRAFDVRLDQVVNGQWKKLVHEDDLPGYLEGRDACLGGKTRVFNAHIRCNVRNSILPANVRITHVPGNGYVGYVLFHCATSQTCPARDFVQNYLAS